MVNMYVGLQDNIHSKYRGAGGAAGILARSHLNQGTEPLVKLATTYKYVENYEGVVVQ